MKFTPITEDRPRKPFTLSVEASLLTELFRAAKVGDAISYAAMEAAISRPLGEIRSAIRTALTRCLHDRDMVFANVKGEGYIRLADEGIVDGGAKDTRRIRRAAHRGALRLTKVDDFAGLPAAKQLEHTARLSVLSAVAGVTREKSIDKIRSVAQGRTDRLPLADTLRAFIGAKP